MKRHPSLSNSLRLRRGRFLRRAARRALGLSVTGARVSHGRCRATRGRRGSTMLVVLGLLGVLMLLGMLYFTFATQEQQSATNFAEAAKRLDDPGDDIDAIFMSALRQLIQGAEYSEKNSAIWGPRHSLLGTLLGDDVQPYSGSGVNLILTATGLAVDQDRDGVADTAQRGYDLRELNDSPAVPRSGVPSLFERSVLEMPAPDVDYTAADHNNPWLAYEGDTFDFSTTPPTKVHVVKPSFQHPELMRDGSFNPRADWYVNPATGARTFRPHPSHLYVWRQDQDTSLTPERRFLIPKEDTNGNTTQDPGEVDYDGDGWSASDVHDDALIATLPGLSGAFPFQVDIDSDGNFNEQGVWSRATGVPAAGSNLYEYDADTDGDGINDAIWMDLDLPLMVRPSDNATYVPLIAFKVMELDSRINVNIAGNLSGETRNNATSNFGDGFFISQSAMGLSPTEINPGWALDAVPGGAATFDVDTSATPNPLTDHLQYFGYSPTSQLDLGNMESWWLNKGRIEYVTPRIIHPGRSGEANRLWQVLNVGGPAIGVQQTQSNLFPFPGVWSQDDNRDANEGGRQTLAGVGAGQALSFQHPLLLGGHGRFWTGPKQLLWHQPVGTNPSRWLRYDGAGLGDDGSGTGNAGWLTPFGGALMTNPRIGANFFNPLMGASNELVDDPLEMTLEPDSVERTYDDPFDPVDTLALNMSKSDRERTGRTSRVHSLMPANTLPATGGTQYQLEVAKRFTTASWDLKTFAPMSSPVGLRAWEWNVDRDGNGLPEFPPQFTGAQAYSANDPFRPQLRRLLTTEFGNTSQSQQPMRLSVNEFLDVEHRQGTGSNPITSPLQYRPLTPHSTDETLATLPSATPLPAYPPTNEGDMEFWARRDRQQMARDIYVMLYTFCGGDNSVDVTTTAGDTAYPIAPPQDTRRQMAQFAVNLVDALDRDNVMSMFEYDNNLSDGWALDDDATTDDGGDRRVVFGVEAQQLTFSEAAWLRQETDGTNNSQTPFNETAGDHNFLHIELRSTSAFDVPLASTASTGPNTGLWRVVRDDNTNAVFETTTENAFELLTGVGGTVAAPGDNLPPGSLFTIASADSSPVGSAALYIDFTGGAADFELVAPNKSGIPPYTGAVIAAADVAPDLDLLHSSHSGRFSLANGSAGDFLSRTSYTGGATTSLALQRRLNPYLPNLSPSGANAPNPYVTVDEFRGVSRRELKFQGDMAAPLPAVASQTDAADRLSYTAPFDSPAYPIAAQERNEPLGAGTVAASTGVVPPVASPHLNTLGRNNSTNYATPGSSGALNPFNFFQPHFDRDFASMVDLFHLSLNGPSGLTASVGRGRRSPFTVSPATFGQAVILQTEDRDGDGALGGTEDLNSNTVIDSNHYHRLLSLMEVPTRTHRQLGDPLKIMRVPGKINLNGVSDPRILAALIDDPTVIQRPEHGLFDLNGNGQLDQGLSDLTAAEGRDFWFSFLMARDGIDPTSGLSLPVSGVSRPFRDMGLMQSGTSTQSNIDDTILRRLPATNPDGSPLSPAGRRLFELADETEFTNGSREPFVRHRLLSKMIGNTTTRSNVFLVFATIGMFECYENPGTGAVRIGGQLKDIAPPNQPITHRAVFMIDRSSALDAYDEGSRTFDWKKLVQARQRIN